MTKSKGRGREKRLPEVVGGPENVPNQDEWAWEKPEDVITEVQKIYFDLDNRFILREAWDGPQLADFCLELQGRIDGQWLKVVRCDCAHDTAHAHYFLPNGEERYRKELMPITSYEAVRAAYDLAYGMIVNKWEDHMRSFLKP